METNTTFSSKLEVSISMMITTESLLASTLPQQTLPVLTLALEDLSSEPLDTSLSVPPLPFPLPA
jgi:hypothetical protein